MIKCLIIDDESLASDILVGFLKPLEHFEVVMVCDNAVDAFNYLKEHQVDLLFLDINMPGMSGLELLKGLKQPPLVIITTAYRDYAVEGFELNVLDYLVKPISPQRFINAIDKVLEKINLKTNVQAGTSKGSADDHIFIKVDKRLVKIFLKDILYIESLKDYVRLKTTKGTFITHQTLTGLTEKLTEGKFIRIHRSYTISLDHVDALDGNAIIIAGKLLPIGRNYLQEIKDLIIGKSIGNN